MLIEIVTLAKTYADGTRALHDLSLCFASGTVVALVGGSGCGKSTLIRLLAGLDRPSRGEVRLDGAILSGPSPRVGVVFQEPQLMPWLSVAHNVGFGLAHLPGPDRRTRVGEALAAIGLPDAGGRWPRELSGGQAQRVAMARALVTRPDALLLDEPFSALDVVTRRALQAQLLSLQAVFRPTVIIVTHDVEEAALLADRVIVLRPRPGRVGAELVLTAGRPRHPGSALTEAAMREIHGALERAVA